MRNRLVFGINVLVVLIVLAMVPGRALQAQTIADLYLFDDLFPIMAQEGITASSAEETVPLDPMELPLWRETLGQIYDPDRMQADFVAVLDAALARRADVAADADAFARSDLGAKVLRLEVSARQALLDDAVDEFARAALDQARAADAGSAPAQRLALVRERIAVNDLVELNVTLGLNTTYAYYTGMMDAAALPDMGLQDILALVWAQEEDIRAEIQDWIESYFLLAYQPLSDDELRAYIAHSAAPLGDEFNRMMFVAFDSVFVDISQRVGAALGRALSAQPL